MNSESMPPRMGEPQVVVATVHEKWWSRIIMGLICSTIVAVIMNFFKIRSAIGYTCKALLFMIGWDKEPPITLPPIDPYMKEAREVYEEGKAKHRIPAPIKDMAKGAIDGKLSKPGGLLPNAGTLAGKAIDFGLDRHAKAREEADEKERKSLLARARAVDLECDGDWDLKTLRTKVKDAEKDFPKRLKLYQKADAYNIPYSKGWQTERIEALVEKAENDRDFQDQWAKYERDLARVDELIESGPNATCPGCRYNMRISEGRLNGKGKLVCPRCQRISACSQAKAFYRPPPRPKPPSRKKGLLERFLG